MEDIDILRCGGPWPGPIPYDEKDRRVFFGRTIPLREVFTRLQHRLILLTASSGGGKTSFIRAALVPDLRRRRADALNRENEEEDGAVLIVRDWPARFAVGIDDVLCTAIRSSLEDKKVEEVIKAYADDPDLAASIRKDCDRLKGVSPDEGSAYDYIVGLSEAVGSLVLVFDQFEEALQGSDEQIEMILQTLAQLYRSEPRVRFLLSLRPEGLSHLRKLEARVSGLGHEVYFLAELSVRTVREALLDSARVADIELDEAVVDDLLSWSQQAVNAGPGMPALGSSGQDRPMARQDESGVNLLKLQAVLLELYYSAVTPARSRVHISRDTLDRLVESYGQSAIDGLSGGPALVKTALYRFIDRFALPLPALEREDELEPAQESMLAQRWAAARIVPHLASGTLKVKQLEESLVQKAWGYQWRVLEIEGQRIGKLVQSRTLAGCDKESLQAGLGLTGKPVDSGARILSGKARAEGWSKVQVVEYLLKLSRQTMDRLIGSNVVRTTRLAEGVAYELVHDGFAEDLTRWAEETSFSSLSALTTPVAQRGVDFRWSKLPHSIRDVCWVGCSVCPRSEGESLILRDIRFANCDLRGTVFRSCVFDSAEFLECDLRGTVFESCTFHGGGFHKCSLTGAIFMDCRFHGSEKDPFAIKGGRSSGLTFLDCSAEWVHFRDVVLDHLQWFGAQVAHVLFKACTMNHWTADKMVLHGPLHIDGGRLEQCDLRDLEGMVGAEVPQVSISNSHLCFCRLNEAFALAVDADISNTREPDDQELGTCIS